MRDQYRDHESVSPFHDPQDAPHILTSVYRAPLEHFQTLQMTVGSSGSPWWIKACRVAVAALFVAPRLVYDIECHGLERVVGGKRTYFAISHKRDLDSFLPLPLLLGRRGWRALTEEVHFATRADAFTPGFLARLIQRPAWLSRLLHPINVGPIIHALGAHPIESLHARPLEEWIREALYEDPEAAHSQIGATLAPPLIHALAQAAGETDAQVEQAPLAQALAWRYHSALVRWYGPELFTEDARRRAEWRVVREVKRQINDIAQWFQQGGSLYSAPEGRLSPTGRLSAIASGFHRLLRQTPAGTRIVPIALVYDTMTTGRPRLFVDVAEPIEEAMSLPVHELDARLQSTWLSAMRFTCTQLASGALIRLYVQTPDPEHQQGQQASAPVVTLDALTQTVHQWAQTLAERGRNVDRRLLRQRKARRLVGGYIRYAERKGILLRVVRGQWVVSETLPELEAPLGDVGYTQAPLAYAYNEFQEMLSVDYAEVIASPEIVAPPQEQAPLPGNAPTLSPPAS